MHKKIVIFCGAFFKKKIKISRRINFLFIKFGPLLYKENNFYS